MMFDIAGFASKGRRKYQEDAVAIDFPERGGKGFVVLADGMGGHRAGDVASRLVVAEITNILQHGLFNGSMPKGGIPELLRKAALAANASIASYITKNRRLAGMGATLVAPVLADDYLYPTFSK